MALDKISPYCKLCESCNYYRYQNSVYGSCDYIGIEGHSRVFKGREKRLEKGTCDKYIPKDRDFYYDKRISR